MIRGPVWKSSGGRDENKIFTNLFNSRTFLVSPWKSLSKLDARFKFFRGFPSLPRRNFPFRSIRIIETPLIKHLRVSLSFYFRTFQGMIYLHDSVIKYHGSLSTSNCLVDSRWVVKLADFGLHEFKKNAECEPCDVMKKYHGKREEYTNLHWTIKK